MVQDIVRNTIINRKKFLHSSSLQPSWEDNTDTQIKYPFTDSTFPEWLWEVTEFGTVRNTKMNKTET